MGVAHHAPGAGPLTLHTMLSLDPLMGKNPLLLQNGEQVVEKYDRKNPHDF